MVAAVEQSPRYTVVHVDSDAEGRAFGWLLQHDEREYSFVDATSFETMRGLRIQKRSRSTGTSRRPAFGPSGREPPAARRRRSAYRRRGERTRRAAASRGALLDAGPASGDPFEGEGTIEFFRFVSEDGQFAVAEVTLDDGTAMPVVGALGHLAEGERALVRGAVEHHSRHGLQITVTEAQPLDPTGAEGARRYLRSLPGIGAKAGGASSSTSTARTSST